MCLELFMQEACSESESQGERCESEKPRRRANKEAETATPMRSPKARPVTACRTGHAPGSGLRVDAETPPSHALLDRSWTC